MVKSKPLNTFATAISKRSPHPSRRCQCSSRQASTFPGMAELSEDVDPTSSLQVQPPGETAIKSFDPIKRSRQRTKKLPPSRSAFFHPFLLILTLLLIAINSNPRDTTVGLCIRFSLLHLPILLRELSFLVHFLYRASSRPTQAL